MDNPCWKPPQGEHTNPNYFEGGFGFGVWGFRGLNPVGAGNCTPIWGLNKEKLNLN